MKFTIFCAFLVALFPQFVQAAAPSGGHEIGNGGDMVRCTVKDGSETLEILDVFEAREVRGLKLVADPDIKDPIELAKSWVARLAELDPGRLATFMAKVDGFLDNMMLLEARDFPDIKDASTFPLPKNCKMLQIAIQAPKKYAFDKEYFINADLWNHLPMEQQAALILHEIIYSEMLRHGHRNSDAARYFNSLLFSNKIKELNHAAYINMVEYLNMDRIFWHDAERHISWTLSQYQYFNSGEAKKYCYDIHMQLAGPAMPDFAKNIENLMRSFIGTYYFGYANNPTAVWIENDMLSGAQRILIFKYRAAEIVVNPQEDISRRALCYAEG